MRDLNAASLDDVRDFFKTYYAPNNAVLVLAGDLDPAEALEKVRKAFGGLSAQPIPPAPDLNEEERFGERRTLIKDPLARVPRLDVTYLVPPGAAPEHAAVDALAVILAGGKSSRLYQRLVKEKELATEVDVQADMRIGPSLLYINAMPRPGTDLAVLEKSLDEVLEDVRAKGVTPAELEKAQRLYRRHLIQGRQTALNTAVQLGEFAVKFKDPALINSRFEALRKVTPAQVQEAARKYLIPTGRTVVVTVPEGKS